MVIFTRISCIPVWVWFLLRLHSLLGAPSVFSLIHSRGGHLKSGIIRLGHQMFYAFAVSLPSRDWRTRALRVSRYEENVQNNVQNFQINYILFRKCLTKIAAFGRKYVLHSEISRACKVFLFLGSDWVLVWVAGWGERQRRQAREDGAPPTLEEVAGRSTCFGGFRGSGYAGRVRWAVKEYRFLTKA